MLEDLKTKYHELSTKKRTELKDAVERGEVGDPIFTPTFFISLAVSAAVSTACGIVNRSRKVRSNDRY